MSSWQTDKRWSDRFLPEIKRILGECLISEAAPDEDAIRNTDLMVLTLGAVRVGCRVRQWQYAQTYGHQFTIRSERGSGTQTELAKIMSGWGDYFFYGFADATDTTFAAWLLGDLKVFRLWFHYMLVRTKDIPGAERHNGDGSSSFRVFNVAEMPPDFVVARRCVSQEVAA